MICVLCVYFSFIGDIVVFTSTDFDMNQAELVKIANCERPTECSNNQIKLESKYKLKQPICCNCINVLIFVVFLAPSTPRS